MSFVSTATAVMRLHSVQHVRQCSERSMDYVIFTLSRNVYDFGIIDLLRNNPANMPQAGNSALSRNSTCGLGPWIHEVRSPKKV